MADDLQKRAKETADAKRLRANIKALNQLYKLAKQDGLYDLSVFKDNKIKFMQLSGSEPKRGQLLNLGKAGRSKKRTEQLLNLTERVLASQWVTPEGRKKIYEKIKLTHMQRYGVSEKEFLQYTDIYNTRVYAKLKDAFGFSSDFIRDSVVSTSEITSNDFEKATQRLFENYKNDETGNAFNPYDASPEEIFNEIIKIIKK